MSWTCPKCGREFPKAEQRHYCARVSLDSLFAGRPAELVLLFDKLLAEVADWDGVLVDTTPNCIVFTHRLTFLVIRPMKKELDIKFYTKTAHPEKPFFKSTAPILLPSLTLVTLMRLDANGLLLDSRELKIFAK